MIKAVIYARYSTEMQRDGNSIEGQILACKEYANKNNFVVTKIYSDEAVSGQKKNRYAFQQIILDAKKGMFDAVIVHALTRATRFQDLFDYYNFKNELSECNVQIYSVTEDIQNNEIGDLIEFMSIWQSKREIINIKKNVLRGMKVNAVAGKFNGGYPPLGYYVDEQKNYQINGDEAKIVKEIFNLALNGIGYYKIAHELNNKGIHTRFGRPFGANSIREILKNKKYIGIYEYNKTPARDKYGKRNSHAIKDESEIIVVENVIPQIIDKEVFEMVQKNIKLKPIHTNESSTYLLSGLLKCENCGYSYSGKYMNARDKYYYECCGKKRNSVTCCATLINRDVIETEILNYIKELLSEKTHKKLSEFFEKNYEKIINESIDNVAFLKKQLNTLKNEAKTLVQRLLTIDSDTLGDTLKEKEEQIKILTEKVKNAENVAKSLKCVTFDTISEILSIKNDLNKMDREALKEVINLFIKNISVLTLENGDKKITVTTRLSQLLVGDTDCITFCGAGDRT